MRFLISILLIGMMMSCSPALLGTWKSGPEWVQFKKHHVFRAGESDNKAYYTPTVEKWYTVKTYDTHKKAYIERFGPGKNTIFRDRIYFKYNEDTVPAFEYVIGKDTLYINAYGESVGGIYLREKK